eukprot:352598-Chlamydomonas_euryale.AAC.6
MAGRTTRSPAWIVSVRRVSCAARQALDCSQRSATLQAFASMKGEAAAARSHELPLLTALPAGPVALEHGPRAHGRGAGGGTGMKIQQGDRGLAVATPFFSERQCAHVGVRPCSAVRRARDTAVTALTRPVDGRTGGTKARQTRPWHLLQTRDRPDKHATSAMRTQRTRTAAAAAAGFCVLCTVASLSMPVSARSIRALLASDSLPNGARSLQQAQAAPQQLQQAQAVLQQQQQSQAAPQQPMQELATPLESDSADAVPMLEAKWYTGKEAPSDNPKGEQMSWSGNSHANAASQAEHLLSKEQTLS